MDWQLVGALTPAALLIFVALCVMVADIGCGGTVAVVCIVAAVVGPLCWYQYG